jgi:hypothetical protein
MAMAANRAMIPRIALKDQYSWKAFIGFSLTLSLADRERLRGDAGQRRV